MLTVEALQERILKEMDLSKEVADEELMEVIRRILDEDGKRDYIPLREKAHIGKDVFTFPNAYEIMRNGLQQSTGSIQNCCIGQ